ncbi:hypothetical protein G6M89_16380 [Natronolimnobius sp. AArcel1]|uniref:hypothetical protein n=1 Tax=Natronolimnobius sp. AArcel1 TaxID=1679093 RepID=UPI0013EACCE3|nr:hypothetical protein [Natronolimnobius sp. AArcel1]NGM70559.1 hypothetical protein [Natronolimnobius sp. AArcel1]
MKRYLFFFCVVLLVLLAFSAPFVEPGSGEFVVFVLSLVFIGATFIGIALLSRLESDPFDRLF